MTRVVISGIPRDAEGTLLARYVRATRRGVRIGLGTSSDKRTHHPDDEDDTIAREELYQIRQQLDLEKRDGWRQGWVKGWLLLFSRKSYRKRLLFGFLLL